MFLVDSIFYGRYVVYPVGGYSAALNLKGGVGDGNTLELKLHKNPGYSSNSQFLKMKFLFTNGVNDPSKHVFTPLILGDPTI